MTADVGNGVAVGVLVDVAKLVAVGVSVGVWVFVGVDVAGSVEMKVAVSNGSVVGVAVGVLLEVAVEVGAGLLDEPAFNTNGKKTLFGGDCPKVTRTKDSEAINVIIATAKACFAYRV